MNKTHHELCDENIQLREQLDAAQASTNLARLATRQAMARVEQLENGLWGACAQINDHAATLDLIREALGVPAEPHQGMPMRILEAAERLATKAKDGCDRSAEVRP